MDLSRSQEALTQSEVQLITSRIWNRITDFISYDDNRNAKHLSLHLLF